MDIQDPSLSRLCNALENAVGRKMRMSRDFDYLSMCVSRQVRQNISSVTLKRLWGYYEEKSTPRYSTLDLLSQYLGYQDWDDFCRKTEEQQAVAPDAEAEPPGGKSPELLPPENALERKSRGWLKPLLFLLPVLLIVSGIFAAYRFRLFESSTSPMLADDSFILRKGQTFDSYEDYLRLFGIILEDTTFWHWQFLPQHEHVEIWGPQYRHPEWHNEGNADSLMPTITEYWTSSEDKSNPKIQAIQSRMNKDGYYATKYRNALRITFMRGLPDTGSAFTFLGVYRISSKSDTTHVIWERVSDECNLRTLDYLELLRR